MVGMVVVMVLVVLSGLWLLCIGGNGDIVSMVLMTTAVRVAVEVCTFFLFNCMFCGGICSVGNGIGGSDIS